MNRPSAVRQGSRTGRTIYDLMALTCYDCYMLPDFNCSSVNIEGTFAVLERGLPIPNPEWLLPDEVVEQCARQWSLLEPEKVGMDPFAGTATIPDVINRMGGKCDANELNPLYCSIAEKRLPHGSLLRQGDYRDINTPGAYCGYDYIYTSPPFAYFVGDMQDKGELASHLYRMLGGNGKLIIDSAATAVRDSITIHPAASTTLYFSYLGFYLEDWMSFSMPAKEGCDSQFTELLFAKRSYGTKQRTSHSLLVGF